MWFDTVHVSRKWLFLRSEIIYSGYQRPIHHRQVSNKSLWKLDTFIIYSISCKRCPNIEYIGQTSQSAVRRFTNHRSDVTSKLDKPVAEHFNLPSHDKSDMIFIPFEKLRKKDATLLNVRERFWINKKETLLHGLNRQ